MKQYHRPAKAKVSTMTTQGGLSSMSSGGLTSTAAPPPPPPLVAAGSAGGAAVPPPPPSSSGLLSDINPGCRKAKDTKAMMYSDLIRSSIVNVKTDKIDMYFVESLGFSFASESVCESLGKISSLKPWLGIMRIGLPLIECHNSNLQVVLYIYEC